EHSGTHIDALCHQACGMKLFGDILVEKAETPAGFTCLGVETVPPLLGRGVLLDVAGWKGQSPLPHRYSISDDDLKACADVENVNLEELASERHYEFSFLGIPLKFKGATGSPLRPLALI